MTAATNSDQQAPPSKYMTEAPDLEGMPPGIPYIIGNEAAERFSFYGMKAILATYLTTYMLNASGIVDALSPDAAKERVHLFVFATYFTPVLGAFIADTFLGKYRTILLLSLVYCAGHAVLALADVPQRLGLHGGLISAAGLSLIALGAGGIKPCVSAHVGDQFGRRNQPLIETVFNWFYWSINLGAFLGTLITPFLLKDPRFGPAYAFGLPGIMMALATFVFWLGRSRFAHIPAGGLSTWEDASRGENLLVILRLIPVYVIVAFFWSVYDQTAGAWVFQAKTMNRTIDFFGKIWTPTEEQIQAINPILILIYIPVFTNIIYPLMNRVLTMTPLRKMAIGMFLSVAAFGLSGWAQHLIDLEGPGKIHVSWQIWAYVLITAAEVMVSTTCLEFSYTQAPPKMKSVIMAMFMLSVSAGNLLTAIVNRLIQNKDGTSKLPGASYYWFFTAVIGVAALLFLFVVAYFPEKTARPTESEVTP